MSSDLTSSCEPFSKQTLNDGECNCKWKGSSMKFLLLPVHSLSQLLFTIVLICFVFVFLLVTVIVTERRWNPWEPDITLVGSSNAVGVSTDSPPKPKGKSNWNRFRILDSIPSLLICVNSLNKHHSPGGEIGKCAQCVASMRDRCWTPLGSSNLHLFFRETKKKAKKNFTIGVCCRAEATSFKDFNEISTANRWCRHLCFVLRSFLGCQRQRVCSYRNGRNVVVWIMNFSFDYFGNFPARKPSPLLL